ncbi:MAG: MarR family transcriptional regulator [Methylobacteriaceae bacterium]|jgi:DNA-binding MarR family transcriptional regulator|nr:MarR family transcriptional regulator [Methylobacteriaceae bacterium]
MDMDTFTRVGTTGSTFETLLLEGGQDVSCAYPVNDLLAMKLWRNPCWFSARLNFLALHFNVPVYRWIEERCGLPRPEFVVLFTLYLKNGLTSTAISTSTGFPKNTISRAVQKLLKKNIIKREASSGDLRSFVLILNDKGRAIVNDSMELMVAREREMLQGLTAAEQLMLSELLAKVAVCSERWSDTLIKQETTK